MDLDSSGHTKVDKFADENDNDLEKI